MIMNKINDLLAEYNCKIDDKLVAEKVSKLLHEKLQENKNIDVYKTCFSCIDLTSLNSTDTIEGIQNMMVKVNSFKANYPDMPQVGAVCVYPSMVEHTKKTLTEKIGIASVSAGFPSSQTFIEVKVAETAMCILEGATEIDIVISIGKFFSKDYETVAEEISELKAACRDAHLKVILETGALRSAEEIKTASIIAMEAGADFIKTSTGKMEPAATLEAAYIMCESIKEFYEKSGKKIGFKPAGGIVSTEDACKYYTIVKEVLGTEWLNNELFRIGASRLANNLLTDIYQKEIKYF
jgi:deoxyribose-phosphate aldolase